MIKPPWCNWIAHETSNLAEWVRVLSGVLTDPYRLSLIMSRNRNWLHAGSIPVGSTIGIETSERSGL